MEVWSSEGVVEWRCAWLDGGVVEWGCDRVGVGDVVRNYGLWAGDDCVCTIILKRTHA